MVPIGGRAVATILCLLGVPLRAGPWPAVQSDLPPDPAVRWGALANGLRYAVRPNAEPQGRVSLRLLVAAGSAEEQPDEQGLAHFIEHMAYRGTRTHPGDSLTTELQQLGIGFGPDATAFTFLDHTIYHLDLPDNSPPTLRAALEVLREYAEEITFSAPLIERERNVILNERDTRDTPAARAEVADLTALWPDSLAVRRRPIGLTAQVRRFTRTQFVRFYDAWYRPERMAVIVVGDVDPALAVELLGGALGQVKARGRARAEVALTPAAAMPPAVDIFTDPGISGMQCLLVNPVPEPTNPDTHAHRTRVLQRYLSLAMLDRRTRRITQDNADGLVSPVANVGNPVHGWITAYFGASGTVAAWPRFLPKLEELRRAAAEFGFSAAELDLARAAALTSYQQYARSAATWHSDWIATQLANAMIEGQVFAAPATVLADLEPELARVTPADCLAAFRRAWGPGPPHLFVTASPSLTASKGAIAKVLADSRLVRLSPPADLPPATFAYQDFGPPRDPVESQHVDDLDVWQAQYANGVRLNFKPTEFEANSVKISVRVGTGRLTEPAHRPGFELLANALANFGGLGRHSYEEVADILSLHAITLGFGVDSDALALSLRCAPADLELALRLVAAFLTDAGFRPESAPKGRAWMSDALSNLANSPAGPIAVNATRILSGGDSRFAGPTREGVDALRSADVRAWLEPQLRHGPLEIAMAGATSWDAVTAAVGATLGALPARDPRTPATTEQLLHMPEQPDRPVYLGTSDPSLKQVALAWFCPAPDVRSRHQERRCRLLAAVLSERLRVRLREELGAAYGFDADFAQQEGFPDFNFFTAYTAVDAVHARRANELIRIELARLADGQLTEDEFQRVRQPFLQTREKDLRDNDYWCYTVLARAQLHPEYLEAARDRTADSAAITREEVLAIAARHFGYAHWFQFVAFPQTGRAVQPLAARAGELAAPLPRLSSTGSH